MWILPAAEPGYRPESYRPDALSRLANIPGDVRKACAFDALIEERLNSLPPIFFAEQLPEEVLQEHLEQGGPALIGGERLPPYLEDEVEIARLTFDTGVREVIAIRARQQAERVEYRVVADPERELHWPVQTSDSPLTLKQLTDGLMAIRQAGSEEPVLPSWWNSRVADGHDEAAAIVNVKALSFIYPMLNDWYQDVAVDWALESHLTRVDPPPRTPAETEPADWSRHLFAAVARGEGNRLEEIIRSEAVDLNAPLSLPPMSKSPGGFGCNQNLAERIFPLFGYRKGYQLTGATPLMVAAAHGQKRVAADLLRAGADPEIADGAGKTAADIAEQYGHEELGRMLRTA